MLKYLTTATQYCLGNGSKKECYSCKHNKVWEELNTLPDPARLDKQKHLKRLSDDACILSGTSLYEPVQK